MIHDPLLQYEYTHQHGTHAHSWLHRTTKFLSIYLLLTGGIFALLMGVMNFSAYSAVVTNWVNPDALLQEQGAIEQAIDSSSISVHATGSSDDSLATLTAKVAATDPDLIYASSYDATHLMAGVSQSPSDATFDVTPYENRIVIPKLGKNIPLIDVDHEVASTEFGKMQDVFMDELKKGVVRYPGTAHPGEVGNTFIFGHSSNYPWIQSEYNDVFALLDTLSNSDEIIIYYNQHQYIYRVSDRATVEPGDTTVLSKRDPNKKELSLMTCWPVGTALERYIIFATLVEKP